MNQPNARVSYYVFDNNNGKNVFRNEAIISLKYAHRFDAKRQFVGTQLGTWSRRQANEDAQMCVYNAGIAVFSPLT